MQKFLKSLPIVGRPLVFLHWKYVGWKFNPTRLIEKEIGHYDEASVVVIGANDGPSTDPAFQLFKNHPNWHGTFVEPVPYLFEKLKKNYGDSARYSFVNTAISSRTGEQKFYFVSPSARADIPALPTWVEQLGSFDRNHIAAQLQGRLAPYITEIDVPAITLHELFARVSQKRLDLLVLDTEGHDWKILQQLDLDTWRPQVIVFENCAISGDEKEMALDFLASHYRVRDIGKDYFCTRLAGQS